VTQGPDATLTAGPVIRSSLALAALLALYGCGPRYVWVKDVSQDELNRDRYECERDMRAGALSFGTGIVGQINANEFMGRCFQAKGYTLRAVEDMQQSQAAAAAEASNKDQRTLCDYGCNFNYNADPACLAQCRRTYPLPGEGAHVSGNAEGGATHREGPNSPCVPAGPEDCIKDADGQIIKCPKCKFLTGP